MLTALSLLLMSDASAGRADVGGYFRVAARPDLQGGSGRLGYWNLYGRLMNEGSYGMVELRYDVLEPSGDAPWTTLHARFEGGSIAGADDGNGFLGNFRMSQVFIESGNVGIDKVTWRFGSLEYFFGDMGLYDMRPATLFFNTVGARAEYRGEHAEVLVGIGDAGYGIRGFKYSAIPTVGAAARVRVPHFEIGAGAEVRYEPGVLGSVNAPYHTPNVEYEDWVRGEVAERYLQERPGLEDFFWDPEPRRSLSYNAVGYLGFGGFGPIRWNNLFVRYSLAHPDTFTEEQLGGKTIQIYVHDFTDDRRSFTLGNEMQLNLVPKKLDAAWGVLYGDHSDGDNAVKPSDHDRWYASTVLRLQAYATPTIHVLAEGSLAREYSKNGNNFREHHDSIFENTGGQPDVRGLEYGDTDTRDTMQLKGGLVINPLGPGVFSRPSLRALYGVQLSNVNNAFGNAFVVELDQYDDFETVEQHVHHLLALEAEVWF
ncbi:MAG: hypothetical protein H6737_18495 [Alphaproteobacteria bacterium]|nr:hypothetical protein [Alphaproteobacteria bacterium]